VVPARRPSFPEERGGSRGRLSLFVAVVAPLVLGLVPGTPTAGAQSEIVIELPDPGRPPAEVEAQVVEIEVDRSQLGRAMPPLGEVPLGQLSPTNPARYASGTIMIRVRAPAGWFPPYTIEARTLSPGPPGTGDFTKSDVGMGVMSVVASNPVINPRFNYDPRVAPKNADDVPIFDGTVATLPPNPPRLWLYRTQGFFIGQWNSFILAFAVGPQFFAPSGPETMRIEVAVRSL
jgi:hypothetical protein